jgi:hypothetical protein
MHPIPQRCGRFQVIHHLKTWPQYFAAIRDGSKTFEIRSEQDRTFAVGDVLVLQEYEPESLSYTCERETRVVTYIVRGPAWNLPIDMVVMGFRNPIHPAREVRAAAKALVDAADACEREAENHPSSRSSAPLVRYVAAMSKLRETLKGTSHE